MDLYDATLRAQIAQITKNIFDTGKRTMQFRFYLKAKEVWSLVFDCEECCVIAHQQK